ncbi:MAG: ATP-binding protein [Elusimicrobia bacterium]|nr:ATP-binding protein [Elusimicrobiota bacterium]
MEGNAELYRLIFSGSPDAMIVFDLDDGRIKDVNDAAVRLWGFSREEMVGALMTEFSSEPGATKGVFRRLANGETVRTWGRLLKRKDGTTFTVDGHAAAVDFGGRKLGLSINRDNTTLLTAQREQKKAEEALREAERGLRESHKMEAVGRLAGGVAHDFNNILSAILGLADLSIKALPEGDPTRADLEEIRRSGLRAANLTRQLLAFSRRQAIVPKVLALDTVVFDVAGMLERTIGEQVRLSVEPAAAGACIRADTGQIEQLIVNLALNARDAMPSGGLLRIATGVEALDAESAALRDGLAAGEYAVLTVSDTGSGMDEEVRARIFEPFFTTKEQGKGTGLGLAVCYGIAKQLGGSISCVSAPGRGSAFSVYLPSCDPEGAAPELPPATTEVRGTERVLVVEDEEAVRRLIVRTLRGSGFETVEAVDGREGLEVLGRDADHLIRLVVSDLVMPRLDGPRLAAAAAVLRPDLPVLFISGYAADAEAEFLTKPFTSGELLVRVRRAIDAARP